MRVRTLPYSLILMLAAWLWAPVAPATMTWGMLARSAKKGRPVRVTITPAASLVMPNRSNAACPVRAKIRTARDPMCFSWQTTSVTAALR